VIGELPGGGVECLSRTQEERQFPRDGRAFQWAGGEVGVAAVTVRTCIEQLLHEVHDPAAYVSADIFDLLDANNMGTPTSHVAGQPTFAVPPRPTVFTACPRR
jgi:hypothetical protein